MTAAMLSRPTFSSPAADRIYAAGRRFQAGSFAMPPRQPAVLPPPEPLPEAVAEMVEAVFGWAPVQPTIRAIQDAVCERWDVARVDLLSARRIHPLVEYRQVAMYLARELTTQSMPEIGRRFGGRNHATVWHAVRKIEALIAAGDPVAADVEALRAELAPEVGSRMGEPAQ